VQGDLGGGGEAGRGAFIGNFLVIYMHICDHEGSHSPRLYHSPIKKKKGKKEIKRNNKKYTYSL
jgi:hypothetical protein